MNSLQRKAGDEMTLNKAIQIMTEEIICVLADNKPTIYLFGSVALDDFKLGWSDIDIVVLTEREISEHEIDVENSDNYAVYTSMAYLEDIDPVSDFLHPIIPGDADIIIDLNDVSEKIRENEPGGHSHCFHEMRQHHDFRNNRRK